VQGVVASVSLWEQEEMYDGVDKERIPRVLWHVEIPKRTEGNSESSVEKNL